MGAYNFIVCFNALNRRLACICVIDGFELHFIHPPIIVHVQSRFPLNSEAERASLLLIVPYLRSSETGLCDFLDTEDVNTKEKNQFNPKIGAIWEPIQGTTLRAAAFRVLKRTLITNQTLEPTQVAGFNQFFDDVDATEAWRFGGAIDQIFSKSLYGGAEYTYRDLEVPFTAGGILNSTDWEERITRGYLFWTPHKWLALTAEYRYEQFERDTVFALGVKNVDTHWLPLGLNFFHPSGLSLSLKGTWVDQQGSFFRQAGAPGFEDGQDSFWLADAAIRYRLPKRYGFLSLGVTNLFDEDFLHFDSNFGNPRIQPVRSLFASVTLNF